MGGYGTKWYGKGAVGTRDGDGGEYDDDEEGPFDGAEGRKEGRKEGSGEGGW